jgi:hypothetical protein
MDVIERGFLQNNPGITENRYNRCDWACSGRYSRRDPFLLPFPCNRLYDGAARGQRVRIPSVSR